MNDIARIDVRHQARTESLREIDEAGNVEIEVVEDVPLQLDSRGVLGVARQRTRRRGIPGTGHAEQRHLRIVYRALVIAVRLVVDDRSEVHTSELQSLMRISYAVF